ncbi:MAG: hypothetical protein KF746_00170 [Chitinophagaceae bacterium]|nr:hypothetical protein [Chitinophagaceae bacterium]
MPLLYISLISFLHFFFRSEHITNTDIPATGIYDASLCGITGNGAEMSGKISQIFSYSNVKELVFAQPGANIVVNGVVNIPAGKIIRFENNTRIVGSGVIHGGIVRADKHAWIFDQRLTVLPEDTAAQFSVKWYGAKGDGTTDDSEALRATFEMARQKKGGNILFPAGTYIVSRQQKPPYKIISVYSNTKVKGEGMYTTTVKLSPGDISNFRRVFTLGNNSEDVINVEIAHLAIDMSNPFKTYPPPASFGRDAQSAGIFCYGDPYVVRNAYFHDLFIHDVSGDIIGVSKNSKNITVERIYQRDYLRQGISIGGNGGVDSITVKYIYDLPFENGVVKGGNSIHTEPAATVKNIIYSNCNISDFSASGIDGLLIDSITTTSPIDNKCNNVKGFLITRSVLNGRLQVAPAGKGKIENNMLNRGVYVTSVGKMKGFRNLEEVYISYNTIKSGNVNAAAVKITQVGGVNVINNAVESNVNAIEFTNAGNGKIVSNQIQLVDKKFMGIYVYSTIPARYGEGMYVIDSNIVANTGNPIKALNVSCIVGRQNTTPAGEHIIVSAASAKLFPFENKGANILWLDRMPQWGLWQKGDIIHIANPGEQYDMICTQGGALHAGKWDGTGLYRLNDYVKASDNHIYKAIAAGGQVQDPVTDHGTYWAKVASEEARFERK